MAFGKSLARFRKERGWTQEDLVRRCKIGIAQIRRYEAGKSQPTLDAIARLAKALGVSADDLVFDDVSESVAGEHILDRDLLAHFAAISRLDHADKDAVKRILASVIVRNQVESAMKSTAKTAARK
jgi:transcriptional regulator with XRE-family HTH domain